MTTDRDIARSYEIGAEYARQSVSFGARWPFPGIEKARGEADWAKRNNRSCYRAYWLGFLRHAPR